MAYGGVLCRPFETRRCLIGEQEQVVGSHNSSAPRTESAPSGMPSPVNMAIVFGIGRFEERPTLACRSLTPMSKCPVPGA